MSDNDCPCCRDLMLKIDELRAEIDAQKEALADQLTARKHNEAEIERLRAAVNYWQLAANHANEAKEVATNTYEVKDNVFQVVPERDLIEENKRLRAERDRYKGELSYMTDEVAPALRAELHKYKAKYEAAEETLRESDKLAAEAQAVIARLRAALERIANDVCNPRRDLRVELIAVCRNIARAALGEGE